MSSATFLDRGSSTMECKSVAVDKFAGGERARSSTGGIVQYNRSELLALQEVHGDSHKGRWLQVLADLGSSVAEELQELEAVRDSNRSRRRNKNSERRQRSRAKQQRDLLQASSGDALGRHRDEEDSFCEDSTNWHRVRDKSSQLADVRKSSWDSRASYMEEREEVDSFQPPAFAVEGEPDFDSGPPQDGWEYLRRVKHEAARCPKVVVAEIDPLKLSSEQTPYMPDIPEIPACPPDLLPSTDWEGHILEEFSQLRTALSNVRMPRKLASERIPPLRNKGAWEVRCFGSITSSPQQEEVTALETISGKDPTPEFGSTEVAEKAAELFPLSSAQSEISNLEDDESGLTGADNTRETPLSLLEVEEWKQDQLSNNGNECGEVSYVIDLESLNAPVPGGEETGSVSDLDYLVNGDAEDALDLHSAVQDDHFCVPELQVQADSAANIAGLDSRTSDVVERVLLEVGSLKNSNAPTDTSGEPEPERPHDGNEGQAYHWPVVCPVYTKRDRGEIPCSIYSNNINSSTLLRPLRESDTEVELRAHHPPVQMDGNTTEGTGYVEASFPYLEALDEGEHHGGVPEVTASSSPNRKPFDHVQFAEICRGIETQFDSLAIEEAEGPQSEIPSLLDGTDDFSELEDVNVPQTGFMNFPVGLEIFNSGNILEDDAPQSDDLFDADGVFQLDPSIEGLCASVFQLSGLSELPFLQLLLRLDEVSRATLFRYHVSWLEAIDGLPQVRAIWLLALSAVVDTPLDAQTGAAFRALLRHCSQIRAMEHTKDGDLHMLNALITVAGLYFGQAQATLS